MEPNYLYLFGLIAISLAAAALHLINLYKIAKFPTIMKYSSIYSYNAAVKEQKKYLIRRALALLCSGIYSIIHNQIEIIGNYSICMK